MSEFADAIIADLKSLILPEAEKLGEEIRDDLVESVSIPVGRAGGKVIRSKAGEPPRKEFGQYAASIQYEIIDEADKFTLSIFTNSMIGAYLESGTPSIQPRPHFQPCFDRWKEIAPERLLDAANGG